MYQIEITLYLEPGAYEKRRLALLDPNNNIGDDPDYDHGDPEDPDRLILRYSVAEIT